MDDPDLAQEENAVHRRAWEANRRRAFIGESRIYCRDCGCEIPEQRRATMKKNGLPCLRCVTCQSDHERSRRGTA